MPEFPFHCSYQYHFINYPPCSAKPFLWWMIWSGPFLDFLLVVAHHKQCGADDSPHTCPWLIKSFFFVSSKSSHKLTSALVLCSGSDSLLLQRFLESVFDLEDRQAGPVASLGFESPCDRLPRMQWSGNNLIVEMYYCHAPHSVFWPYFVLFLWARGKKADFWRICWSPLSLNWDLYGDLAFFFARP